MTIDELMKSWGTFLTLYSNNAVFKHNVELLSRMPLERFGQNIACEAVRNTADLYRRGELGEEIWQPRILDVNETLDRLLAKPQSFCRFGDGEYQIMRGISIPFQDYVKELADKLAKETLIKVPQKAA